MTAKLGEVVKKELVELLSERRVKTKGPIAPEMSLVEDLGLDSLAFVDLTLRLERRLGLGPLPLREWIDTESMRTDDRYTLGSLLAYLEQYVSDIECRQSDAAN